MEDSKKINPKPKRKRSTKASKSNDQAKVSAVLSMHEGLAMIACRRFGLKGVKRSNYSPDDKLNNDLSDVEASNDQASKE